MTNQSQREESIFDAAVELATAEERAAYLRNACGEDAVLRQKVEDLLQAHDRAGAFLETPVTGDLPKPALAAGLPAIRPDGTTLVMLTEKPGDTIGRYKLLQAIGEGGCGVVYMAEQQEPVHRRVALKIIRLGMDTKSVIARFEAERQALAMMDHPNIAKVLDAGATDTGRPFFVMELVRGVRVTEYCDQHNLPTEERLKLFIQICRAIQHAHQKGVIHRDIKPSNILVTLHDGVPVPKVIDFGIAKATDQRLTDKTLFTEFQSFMGTPAYVSPEQAEMSGLDIDTRSDIYSLGVLLYELLTGKTPFDPVQLMRAGLDEMRRTIRESEPVRPSTCLSAMVDAELTTTALRHRLEPPKLISRIRGDLDWIVMKCLEKDRTRRYETTTLLAMDVERYLNQEPVFARPPSRVYQMQKLVRRNKAAFVGASAVTAALIAGLIASTWLFFRERDARKDAVVAEKEQTRLRGVAERARSNEAKERERAESERRAALRAAYNSDMNLIPQAMAANNFGRTVDLLNRHRPKAVDGPKEVRVEGKDAGNRGRSLNPQRTQPQTDLRQWEWRYFWNQFRSDAAFALPRQSNSVTAVVISSDGRFLISSEMPGTLKLWDLFRRAEVATFRERGSGPGPFGSSANFAFSPKGDRLAAVVNEGPRRTMVKIWAVPTHEITAEFPHEGGVQSIAFSPDGTKLLTVGQDFGQDTIREWDLTNHQFASQTRIRLQGEGFRRRSVLFSRDAKRLAIGDDEGRIHIVDTSTGAERSNVAAFENAIAALAFSPDGEMLAATSFVTETDIKLFNVEAGAAVGTLEGHASWVPGLTFTADGKRLISAGADQTVRLWDLKELRELNSLRGHWSEVNCVAVTPDGGTIISGCKDGTLFGWDAKRTERRKQFETLPIRISSIEFLPKIRALLSVNADETLSVWDAATLQETERLSALGDRIRRVVVAPDGSRIYAGTPDGEIRVLDWATRALITNILSAPVRGFVNRPRPMDRGFSFGPIGLLDNGRTLVAGAANGTIRLWDTATWQTKCEWKAGDGRSFHRVQGIISPDERFLLMSTFGGAFGGGIEFHNVLTGQTEATLPMQNWGTSGMAFSPDGNVLATSSIEGTVNLWDVANRSVTDVLRGHLLGVHSVAFSPDGERIASGSHGNEAVKLWDIVTHQEVATLVGQGSMFEFVKFSPGGKMLVAINRQGATHIWRAPSLEEIEVAEKAQIVAGP